MSDAEQAVEAVRDEQAVADAQGEAEGGERPQAPGAQAPGPAAPGGPPAGPPVDSAALEHDEANEVAGDLSELVATAAQRDEYLALAQRTQADFENYRKRVAKESAQAQARGVAKLAKELLPALDSLDRALAAAAQDDPLLDGVRLVRSELIAALERAGIEPFAPLGEPFDPVEQEAVAQQPVEGVASGTVAEVYQTGYRLSGNVIRPARVLVAA